MFLRSLLPSGARCVPSGGLQISRPIPLPAWAAVDSQCVDAILRVRPLVTAWRAGVSISGSGERIPLFTLCALYHDGLVGEYGLGMQCLNPTAGCREA
jgi:hypothetical protein